MRTSENRYDPVIFISVILLIGLGLIMVYSSSAAIAYQKFNDPYYFVKRQVSWIIIGGALMALFMHLDYHTIQKFTYPALIITLFLLVLVLFPQFGKKVGGAQRWLHIGSFSFQPSELAKFTLILYVVHSLVKKQERIKDFFYGYLPNLIVLGFFSVLFLLQPDLGTTMILIAVVFILFFIAGIKFSYLFYSVLMLLPAMCAAILSSEYQKNRIISFLDPEKDPLGKGYQIIQSFMAFSRGNTFGTGLGDGRQKLFFLPEPHTDFIFSIIGEELGFAGTVIVVMLFLVIIWRGIQTAMKSSDLYGTYLSLGLTSLIGVQAMVNLAVAVGLLPTKGLTLPFVSLGGSSLVVSMICAGVLLNISKKVGIRDQSSVGRVKRVVQTQRA
tara:strand:+ start:59 stop:1213 length:1155 start_codon:yes stop_codon:yes gene_type:complete